MPRSGDARSGARPWWAFWRRRKPEPSPDLPPPVPPATKTAPPSAAPVGMPPAPPSQSPPPDSLAVPPADASPLPAPVAAPPASPSPAHERWRQWARAILAAADAWMIVDVETTGVYNYDDIVEIAAVTPRGATLFASLIRPSRPIPPAAVAVHGITDAMVVGAPPFAGVYERLLRGHLAQRGFLAYGANFDVRMLRLSIERHCRIAWEPVRSDDVTRAYAAYHAALHPDDGRRNRSLEDACRDMGIAHDGAHRALGDCLATARVIQAMAR
jgi:DNA polymerase-3 subunit epsilon